MAEANLRETFTHALKTQTGRLKEQKKKNQMSVTKAFK